MGPLPLVQKGQSPAHSGCEVHSRCAVGTQYTVGVSAKGSTHTVGYAVGVQCAVCMQYAVGVSAKRSNPHSGVCSRCTVRSRYAVHSRC